MSAAGRTVELRRYRIPAGQRALKAQRIDGRVAVMDVPVDHDDHVYLVERHVQSSAELNGLAAEYTQRSQHLGQPAIVATRRSVAREIADSSPDGTNTPSGGDRLQAIAAMYRRHDALHTGRKHANTGAAIVDDACAHPWAQLLDAAHVRLGAGGSS